MKILAIETSCDETAISIVEATGTQVSPVFTLLSSVVHSQAPLHAEWSGVVPNLAKREHAKNLIPILNQALSEAGLSKPATAKDKEPKARLNLKIKRRLEREPGLYERFIEFIPNIKAPKIDAIAVTYGPGLEPALWTGISFAESLAAYWDKPVIPINHMEGHILSVLLPEARKQIKTRAKLDLPALALLISGGHTELVFIKDWLKYKVIGHTRDDAVGEAFDKVARMLGLPYPGGPEISKMAEKFKGGEKTIKLPRPMINSDDLDFSFSGLKTAVLYKIKELGELSEDRKSEIAHEFEEAVVEVLTAKTKKALKNYNIKTLIIGGGVIANKKIRVAFKDMLDKNFRDIKLLIPHSTLATDNATMIAIAGYFRWLDHSKKYLTAKSKISAKGNLILK